MRKHDRAIQNTQQKRNAYRQINDRGNDRCIFREPRRSNGKRQHHGCHWSGKQDDEQVLGHEPSANQPIELTAAGCASMYHQKANEHSETRDNDEQIEEDHDFNQQWHAWNQNL